MKFCSFGKKSFSFFSLWGGGGGVGNVDIFSNEIISVKAAVGESVDRYNIIIMCVLYFIFSQ